MNRRSLFQFALGGLVALFASAPVNGNGIMLVPVTDLEGGEENRDLDPIVQDIHSNGVLFPILVRDKLVVDGKRRLWASRRLGLSHIPCRFV